MATTVTNKGGGSKFAVDKCLEFIDEQGDREGKIIVKNDQEPSMQFVITDLIEEIREGGMIIEEPPDKSSGSNGIVEKTAQDIEGRIRSIFLGLQERFKRTIDAR